MKIGAHVSIGKGLDELVLKAKTMGLDCVQLFVSPPRNWNPPKLNLEEFKHFGKVLKENNLTPNFLHGIYLVNLNTDNPDLREKGIRSVVSYMEVASSMNAQGVIIHSHKPSDIFISAIDEILERSSKDTLLIIEHSAVTTIEQTLSLFTKENKSRLGLCLDTCHLFAAGYDVREKKVVDDLLTTIDKTIGLAMLQVIHTNDAKSKLASKRDVHQNLGEGSIGRDAFKLLVNHPKLKDLPFVLETPGFDDKGPDKKNVDILKSLKNA